MINVIFYGIIIIIIIIVVVTSQFGILLLQTVCMGSTDCKFIEFAMYRHVHCINK